MSSLKKYLPCPNKVVLILGFIMANLTISNILQADEVINETTDRCSEDSLSKEEAVPRTKWAVKCKYLSARRADVWLYDDNGNLRPRPLYPTFVTPDRKELWKEAPKTEDAPCNKPEKFSQVIGCTSSCYTPEQLVLFFDKGEQRWVEIEKAYKQDLKTVMTLSTDSDLESPQLISTPVRKYTKEVVDTWNDVLEFRTQGGRSLKVTPNHPIVDGNGYMREASYFKVGDSLIHMSGALDPIISIQKSRHYGQVYNVDTKTKSLRRKIVVAQGFLNGTSYYQNDGFGYMNRELFRENISDDLIF